MQVALRRSPWLALIFFCLATIHLPAADLAIQHTDVYQRLKRHIDQIRLIDTHEHLCSESERLKQPADCLAVMLHYVDSDLVAAGLPRPQDGSWRLCLQDTNLPFDQRWTQFAKYWPEVRLTGYGRALEQCVRDLYDVRLDRLTPETGTELNRRLAEARKPGLYKWVLKDKARIDLSFADVAGSTRMDRDLFRGVLRFDHYIGIHSTEELDMIQKRTGVHVATLEDLVQALAVVVEKGHRDGMVAIKSAMAYWRSIYYPLPPVDAARAVLARLIQKQTISHEEASPLQNYLMHQLCRLAGQHQIPLQIHTGLQTGFGDNEILDSKPTHLINLVKAYPQTKFVIFHGSYPYGPELATMAKNYGNVFIDMCWLHIISPAVARNYLSEWIETVPANKIMGFGGDYNYVEGVFAHAEMARANVAWVLAEKVISGYMTEDDAQELATKILRTNAIALYRLPLS